MRELNVENITEAVEKLCIEANHFLAPDMKAALEGACDIEESELGKQILMQLQENLDIAGKDMIPICQDTGMAVFFIKVGQDVHLVGGSITDAVNKGVSQGYTKGFLRKSVVSDPLIRKNTGDNTPAIIHYDIVPGDKVEITIAPKGFGSENMSRVFMLKPADGEEGSGWVGNAASLYNGQTVRLNAQRPAASSPRILFETLFHQNYHVF